MTIRILIASIMILLAISALSAQLSMTGISTASGPGLAPCGTGVIDASTGCPLPMLGS